MEEQKERISWKGVIWAAAIMTVAMALLGVILKEIVCWVASAACAGLIPMMLVMRHYEIKSAGNADAAKNDTAIKRVFRKNFCTFFCILYTLTAVAVRLLTGNETADHFIIIFAMGIFISFCFLDDYREEARIERWMDKHMFGILIGAVVYTVLGIVMLVMTREKELILSVLACLGFDALIYFTYRSNKKGREQGDDKKKTR